ncbi:MAG TPA: endospore germination permease [Thermoanaerobacterales bacterium]|nr:endospore germination permease [Thermoanaerobacterales bacterium]
MLEKEIIDDKQAVLLIINMILPTALLSLPAITISIAKRDAWISAVLATGVGLMFGRLVSSLVMNFPGKTFFEFSEEILGRFFGKIVGIFFIWWLIHSCSEIVREYGEFLSTAIMPDTPITVFLVVSAIISAYAVKSGFEVLARFNLLFAVLMGVFVLVFAISFLNVKFTRLLPMFDTAMTDILKGTLVPLSWMGEVVVFSAFSPVLKNCRSVVRITDMSILLVGLHFFIGIVGVLMIFGPEVGSAMMYPVFNQVRMISLASFIERLDYIIFMSWVIGGFIKIGIFYFAAVIGVSWMFGLSDYRPIVFPVGIIIVALSVLIHEGIVNQLDFLMNTWPFYSIIIFETGIPLLLWLVSQIKNRRHSA